MVPLCPCSPLCIVLIFVLVSFGQSSCASSSSHSSFYYQCFFFFFFYIIINNSNYSLLLIIIISLLFFSSLCVVYYYCCCVLLLLLLFSSFLGSAVRTGESHSSFAPPHISKTNDESPFIIRTSTRQILLHFIALKQPFAKETRSTNLQRVLLREVHHHRQQQQKERRYPYYGTITCRSTWYR